MAPELCRLERREARARTNLSVPINSGREENRRYRTASGSDRPLLSVSVDNKRPVATARGSVTFTTETQRITENHRERQSLHYNLCLTLLFINSDINHFSFGDPRAFAGLAVTLGF